MFGTVNSLISVRAILSILVFSFVASSCANKTKSNDCDYDRVETYAEIIDIRPHADGNGRIAVILDFKASVLALEDQELGVLKDFEIHHDFIVRNNLEIGLKYSVDISQITKGDCTPRFVSFNHAFR